METHEKLQNIMNCTNSIFDWAKKHNCEFGIEKFQLLDITRKMVSNPINPRRKIPMLRKALMLGNQRIPSKDTARFLGITVNNKLNWKGQCTDTLAKGQGWLIQFNRIMWASRGAHTKYL